VDNKPIVFLDMDGVLADFFSAFSSFAGVKHWKELGPSELSNALEAVIGSDFFSTIPKTWCCDELIAMASEEVAIRSILPQEIDTYDPYDEEFRVWQA